MTGLGDMFEETMGTPPPSRLRADEVYAAGRRRRRRRMAAGASALAVAAATAGVVGVTALTATDPGSGRNGGPLAGGTSAVSGAAGSSAAASAGRLDPRQIIQWSGAADRDHLYLSYFACPQGDCVPNKTTVQLVGSDDGGRTWTERGGAIDVVNLAVIGPDTLLATSRADTTTRAGQATGSSEPERGTDRGEGTYALHVSTDGGRSWTAVARPRPVSQVPPGGLIICWSLRDSSTPCSPYVFDPAHRTFGPLAARPLAVTGQIGDVLTRVPESAPAPLWLAGTDLATGEPTTAVSTDRGRTWSLRGLPGLPACPPAGCEPPELTSGDGRTVYAVVHVPQRGQRLVYRTSGTAGWQRVTGADVVPYGSANSGAGSYVTADGRHVICEIVPGDRTAGQGGGREVGALDRCRFWIAPDGGGAYQPVELAGLPATTYPVRRTPDGWYHTHSYGENRLYGSADGRRWTALSTPER